MLISEINIKNLKSFGNNKQTITLKEKGELILLQGSNGAGKSTFISAFEYALYGKVKGDRKKWVTLGTLPNRINGNLEVGVKFKSSGSDIEVIRGIAPNKLELYENGIINDRAGKSNLDDIIENYIGMDLETFKSFISMSVNDFKDFLSLSTSERQMLLDKLFNLEVINILNDILKEIAKNNRNKMVSITNEINILNESIDSIKNSIRKSLEKSKINNSNKIEELKNNIESRKSEYLDIKSKLEKIKVKDSEISNEIESERNQLSIINNELSNIIREITLYEKNSCPTCATPFNTSHFQDLKNVLNDKKINLENTKSVIEDNIKELRDKKNKIQMLNEKNNSLFIEISSFLKSQKAQIDTLQKTMSTDDIPDDISEFENSIKEIEEKIFNREVLVNEMKHKESLYKEMNKILGDNGVKKTIINSIIAPINGFIQQNMSKIGLPFNVVLNDKFEAELTHLGDVIDSESLSTGEHKLTNICILTAYLMLIKTKKYINILFLDEVFASVDIENTNKILLILKDFATNYNINIFVVHHANLNSELFDRILRIDKNIFTTIIDSSTAKDSSL